MVSLPPILSREGSQRYSTRSGASSIRSISSVFCRDCTQEVPLPISKIDADILRKYRKRCAQIRNTKKLLLRDQTPFLSETPLGEEDHRSLLSEGSFEEPQNISTFDFPLIHQSDLLTPKKDLDLTSLTGRTGRKLCEIVVTSQPKGKHYTRKKGKSRRIPILVTSDQLGQYGKCEKEKLLSRKQLVAEPEVIIFNQLQVGQCYKRKCKITNVSNSKCTFSFHPLKYTSQFRVERNHLVNNLPAGMSTGLTVLFQCRSLADVKERLVVTVQDGDDLVILILAMSPPPRLVEVNDSDDMCNVRDPNGIDSFIDCGSHFVGGEVQCNVNLQNVGSGARFCFLREAEWYGLEFDLDLSNRLTVEAFTIDPMYFALNKGQTIEVSVTFKPPSEGFHIVQLVMLCSNSAIQYVDLIGDGFLFNPNWIRLSGMLKTFDVDIPDDDAAECYIDLGTTLTATTGYHWFEVHHDGYVNMNYHWEMRETVIPGTRPLPPGALSVLPVGGRLLAKTTEAFCLQYDTMFGEPGRYRLMLVLILDDLHRKCVPLYMRDDLPPPNEDEENDLQSIEETFIEVWLECVKPVISLVPYLIEFSERPLVCGFPKETRDIIVKNESPCPLELVWIYDEECPQVSINIEPSNLVCKEFSSTQCVLSVEALLEGAFVTILSCVSESADVGLEIEIKGICCKGRPLKITEDIDFGLVRIRSEQMAQVIVKNSSVVEKMSWSLNEFYFTNTDSGHLEPSTAVEFLSASEGEFCHKDSEVLVNYQLNTQEDTMWCSVLDWGGQYVPVMADVQETDVSLSSHLIHADLLYVGVKRTFTLTVRNHTLINTAVFWGHPTVEPADSVTVDISPRFSVLGPAQSLLTEICLTPLSVGLLKHFYIPCFVESHYQPLLLQIDGHVDGLKVRVEWESEAKHCCVVWPLAESADADYCLSLDSIICPCPPNSLRLGSTESDYSSIVYTVGPEDSISLYKDNDDVVLFNKNNDDVDPFNKDNDDNAPFNEGNDDKDVLDRSNDDDDLSQVSSIPYLNWPIIGGRYTRQPMSEEMERHFNNLFTLEQYKEFVPAADSIDCSPEGNAFCFHDVPVRTAVTQTLYIRNDTMINSRYEACVVNNFERPQEPDDTPVTERIARKIKHKVRDEWYDRASKTRGLTVFVEPAAGDLPPDDYVTLQVTVYAFSWGRYTDAVILQLGGLDQLRLKLTVTVKQPPVSVQPVVRFGAVSFNSHRHSRRFQVENSSTLALYVCWQLFTPSSDLCPFGVMLFDDSPFELHFTPFYGSFTSSQFFTSERYTLLKPWSSTTLEVGFSPYNCGIDVAEGVLSESPRAVLVGHVYLTDEAKCVTNTESCVRDDGVKLDPLTVDLEAYVELPTLSLLNVSNHQLMFKCTSYDVMSAEDKVWQQQKVITVKNECRIALRASVSTVGFFKVTKITHPCDEDKRNNVEDVIFLQPGETCEVTLLCEVTPETLFECFEEEQLILPISDVQAGIVEHGLVIFDQEELRQEVRLQLWLYQPIIVVSVTSLSFGQVYINDTKILSFILKAPIGKELFQTHILSGHAEVFSVSVNSGTIYPNVGLLVDVLFSPRSCATYRDVLVVKTCMDSSFWEIQLSGIGTFNYKSHVY